MSAQLFQVLMCFREVLAARSLPFVEIRHGIQAQAIDAHPQPLVDDLKQRPPHLGVVEVEVRLVRIEAVPVVGSGSRVPCPVRRFEVFEDDSGVRVAFGRIAPDVEISCAATR